MLYLSAPLLAAIVLRAAALRNSARNCPPVRQAGYNAAPSRQYIKGIPMRPSGRQPGDLRVIKLTRNYTKHAEGSVLVEFGDTRVLCTASVEDRVLRAVVDSAALGERTITVDCDVLQADGGTRTASITGGYVALVDAVRHMQKRGVINKNPIYGQVASVSVGIYKGVPVLDLDYAEDSNAETDMNVVMNEAGAFIEVQGTAEGHAFRMGELQAMLELAQGGIGELIAKQRTALAG